MSARDSSTSAQRICPKCGHANSNISLFCAECGAVLNGASTGDTGVFAPLSNTATTSDAQQQTQPIQTASGSGSAEQEWASLMASSDDDTQATAPLPKTTPPVSTVTAPAAATNSPYEAPGSGTSWPTSTEADDHVALAGTSSGISFSTAPEPRGMRGFWFGLIGFLLILIVLGLYGWSILPDGGFRDTVQGWF